MGKWERRVKEVVDAGAAPAQLPPLEQWRFSHSIEMHSRFIFLSKIGLPSWDKGFFTLLIVLVHFYSHKKVFISLLFCITFLLLSTIFLFCFNINISCLGEIFTIIFFKVISCKYVYRQAIIKFKSLESDPFQPESFEVEIIRVLVSSMDHIVMNSN